MNTEEFNRVHTITEEVKKRQAEIVSLYEDGKSAADVHVARGRLIQYIKSNIKELKDLYDKYDMYMTVYEVINNSDEKKDKINYIKNLIYKNSYTPFEEKLLNIINSNIDDIDKMKKEFNDLDENNGIKELIELRETHAKELEKHRKNIDQRYRDEFLKKKTNLLSVVTMLPKAVGLACKKVATCVKEVKQAKSNKEKINKLFSVFKAAGQVVATPVIFVGKFIVDHWYLALVGLIAILKKFNILDKLFDLFKKFWYFLKGKKKKKDDKDKDKDKDGEKAEEPVAEPAAEAEEVPAALHNSAINYQTDPRFQAKPVTTPETVPHTSAIDYTTDPRFQAKPAVEAETPHTSAINYQTDPRFQAQPVQVDAGDAVETVVPETPTPVVTQPSMTFGDAINWNKATESAADAFIRFLEENGYSKDNGYYIFPTIDDMYTYYDAVYHGYLTPSEELRVYEDFSWVAQYGGGNMWLFGQAGLFGSEQQLMDIMNSDVSTYASLVENNTALFDSLMSVNAKQSMFSGININAVSEALGVSTGVAAGCLIVYALIKLGLAIPTSGASLALP